MPWFMPYRGGGPRARWRWAAALALAALAVALGLPGAARAGTFQVRSCSADTPNRSWYSVQPNPRVAAYDACGAFFEGFVSRNSLQPRGVNDPAHWGEDASMRIDAAPGTMLTGLHGDVTSGESPGTSTFGPWRSGIQDEGGWIECGDSFLCWFDSNAVYPHRDYTGRWTRFFRLETVCAAPGGCPRDQQYARTRIRNVTVDVRDDGAPGASAPRGVYGNGAWVSGSQPVGFDAGDSTGISEMRVEIDPGGAHGFGWPTVQRFGCDYSSTVPCANHGLDSSLETGAVSDGVHTLRLCAADAASNYGCLPDQPLRVDNSPVGKVGNSALQGPPGWRAQNGFVVGYDQPGSETDGGEHAPIADRFYEVCRADGSECATSHVAGPGSSVVVDVPGPGEWKARVWEQDAAGHDAATSSNKGDWVALRYDPTPPGAADPQYRSGWTSAGAIEGYAVRLAAQEAVGPSGIAGYAVTTDGSVPGTAVGAPAVDDGTRRFPASFPLHDLPEGRIKVSARAISGAGVPATDDGVGVSEIKIDRTAPELLARADVEDADAWTARPVTVDLSATDQDGLAGLDRIEYAVDGGPTQVRRLDDDGDDAGPTQAGVSVELGDDGVHVLTGRAFDAAGNASALRTVTAHVDRTGPVGGFDPPDPADPTKISVSVSDHCIRSAVVQMRPSGGDWTSLPTAIADGHVLAHIPEATLKAGSYELRAVVTDCAGNTTILNRWWENQRAATPAVVQLPLRLGTVMRASFDTVARRICRVPARRSRRGQRGCRTRVVRTLPAADRPHSVTARLTTRKGRAVGALPVQIQVQRKGAASWTTVARVRTNATGVARGRVPAGPSRTVRVVFGGAPALSGSRSGLLRLRVRATSTIAVSRGSLRNGQSVVVSGRLLGGWVPRGGRELELEGLNPLKRRWQPVQTRGLRAKASGRWTARYRFTATRGRVTYAFRLRIAPGWGYPFEEGYSRIVRVTVTG